MRYLFHVKFLQYIVIFMIDSNVPWTRRAGRYFFNSQANFSRVLLAFDSPIQMQTIFFILNALHLEPDLTVTVKNSAPHPHIHT